MQHAWTVLSCLLGHDYILSQIENEELEFALVLEDDCTPNEKLMDPTCKRNRSNQWQAEPASSEVCKTSIMLVGSEHTPICNALANGFNVLIIIGR